MAILFKFIIYDILITLLLILWITNSTKREHNFIFYYRTFLKKIKNIFIYEFVFPINED